MINGRKSRLTDLFCWDGLERAEIPGDDFDALSIYEKRVERLIDTISMYLTDSICLSKADS